MSTFLAIHPVLQARNVPAAIAWYVDRLGFRLFFRDASQDGATRYAVVSRDGVEIHLQWHDESSFRPDRGDALMMRIRVDDPDALFDEYRVQNVFHDWTVLRDTPWGTREFGIHDLNGHGLVFYRPLTG